MGVGAMKDLKLKLMDLCSSDTLGKLEMITFYYERQIIERESQREYCMWVSVQ